MTTAARRERAEVHERRLKLERGAQRTVVGLVDRAAAIGVAEQRAGLVECVGVGILERRGQCEGGGAALRARAMDALLKRAEADPLHAVLEPVAQPVDRDKVVVGVSKLAGARHRRLSEREVRVGERHAGSFAHVGRARNQPQLCRWESLSDYRCDAADVLRIE